MFYIFGRKVQRCISCRFGVISSTFLGFENSLKLKGVLAFIWALSLIGKYAIVSSKVLFSSKVIFGLKPTIFCVEPGERRSDAICFGFVAGNPGTNSRLTIKRNIVRRFLARTTSRLTLYEISLRRNFVTTKSLRIIVEISANYRFKSDGNPCEISRRYRRNIARTKRDIQRLSFALLFHNTVPSGINCFCYLYLFTAIYTVCRMTITYERNKCYLTHLPFIPRFIISMSPV